MLNASFFQPQAQGRQRTRTPLGALCVRLAQASPFLRAGFACPARGTSGTLLPAVCAWLLQGDLRLKAGVR